MLGVFLVLLLVLNDNIFLNNKELKGKLVIFFYLYYSYLKFFEF